MFVLIYKFAYGGPQYADIFCVDKFFQHRFDFILALSNFGMQEKQYFLNHEFEVVFFWFHYFNDLMDIFCVTFIDLLHYFLHYLFHPRNDLPFVVLKHKFHPINRMLWGIWCFFLRQSLLEQWNYFNDVNGFALIHFLHTLHQNFINIATLLSNFFLLMRHQQ